MVSQPQPAPPRRLRSTRAEPPPDVSCVTAHVPILLLRGHLFRPALNARVSKEAQDMPEKKPQDPAQDPGAASREAGDAALQNAEPKKSQKTRVRIFQRPPCALHALQPMPQC